MKRLRQLFRATPSSCPSTAVLLGAASLLMATACTQRQPTTPTFSTRDSAGIVLAENTGDLPEVGGAWSLSPEPVLEIGDLEGEAPYLFQRIWGACRLADGRIAVMDSPSAELRVFSPIGEHLRTFGRRGEGPGEFMGDELVQATQGDGRAVMTVIGNAPFGKEAVVAVGRQHFFYGSQDRYEIQVWSRDGGLERIIRQEAELLPVSDSQVADRLAEELEHLEDDGNDLSQRYRREFEATPIPDFHPAHGEIHADLLGFLWVEETRPSNQEPCMASIFDPEGRLVATLPLPDELRVLEIGADYVLGSYSDELGVQYLRMYALQRPG
mgnify:FL=1